VQTVLGLPGDIKFDPGNLPDCNLASLIGKSTAAARATCPRSVVGSGTVIQQFSDGRRITGVLTSFNGAPSGGSPTIYVHTDLPGVESKPILNGPIRGSTLSVQVPPVQGSVIERFDIRVNKIVTGKKGKKKKYYFSARCSKKRWTVTETVTYANGKVLTASGSQKCTQKK
jgi:hypothetical protein